MTPDRWQAVSRIYHDALGQPSGLRDAFIRRASDGDAQIEREVRSLLAQPSGDSFLPDLIPAPPAGDGAGAIPGRLGRFEVRGLLGAGGMGEVYRAHDPDLGRDVAVKILPPAFTTDPDRLARFEREARVLAAISHPHIAAIYGVEEIPREPETGSGTFRALVLELVEGDTLADRLGCGRIDVEEALEIARQIADAVEAAHEKGIVHRDLKPGNIKIRPDGVVKILDFGLAKADALVAASSEPTAGRTPLGETSLGVVLGTPAYMSPEQARGLTVDKRSDVWAFGCVLYEMLAGRPAFTGDSAADIIAALLQRDPDWAAVPAATPVAVHRLLRRCLARNLKDRLRDIGDARLDLADSSSLTAPGLPARRRLGRGLLVAACAIAMLTAALFMGLRLRPQSRHLPVHFAFDAGDGQTTATLAIPSPDGTQFVFVRRASSGESEVWTRPLGSTVARRLPGTGGADGPFWSFDGRVIGFSAGNALRRIPAAGGPVQRIADVDPHALGATWSRDDVIVFTPSNRAPLHRVGAASGPQQPLTTLNAARRENSHRWPQFLPDGRHFLFTARSDLPEHSGIYVASLDDPASPRWLMAAQSRATYLSTGHLLFMRDSTLLAQPFDPRTLQLSGQPVAIAGDIFTQPAAVGADYAASEDGRVLTYRAAAAERLVWADRTGAEIGSVAARGVFSQIRLSPDGSRAALVMPDPQNGNRDLWVVALANGAVTRLTSHPASDWFPVWSPDGTALIFGSDRDPVPSFYRVAAIGGDAELVYRAPSVGAIFPTDWAPDGGALLYHSYPRGDVQLLPLAARGGPTPVVASPYTDWVGVFSPDGRWIAYVSDESGESEVYVKPAVGPGKFRVSLGGGLQARWRRDGRELFFLDGAGTLFAAAIGGGSRFVASRPQPLFGSCRRGTTVTAFLYAYDVVADGSRTVWICRDDRMATMVLVDGVSTLLGSR
jgi:serine/threonine protein kinase/Tol biopolymer transport system component